MIEGNSNSKKDLAEQLCSLDQPVNVDANLLAAAVSNRHRRVRTRQRRVFAWVTASIAGCALYIAWPLFVALPNDSIPHKIANSAVDEQQDLVVHLPATFADLDAELQKTKAELAAAQARSAELDSIRATIHHSLRRERLSRDGFVMKKLNSIEF